MAHKGLNEPKMNTNQLIADLRLLGVSTLIPIEPTTPNPDVKPAHLIRGLHDIRAYGTLCVLGSAAAETVVGTSPTRNVSDSEGLNVAFIE